MRRIATRNGRLGLACAVTVSAFAFYSLSIGPACWLSSRGMLSVSQIAKVYRPLLWLDFQMPPPLQLVLSKYADFCGGREKLDAARDVPFDRIYEVGDFAVRFRSRPARPAFFDEAEGNRIQFREFDVCDALADLISSEVEDDTWDHVGGRGSLEPDAMAGSLLVSQSRRAHAGIASLLDELRRIRRAHLPDQDLDLPSLVRIRGLRDRSLKNPKLHCLLRELESHAAIIDRRSEGHWECDGVRFATADAMFQHLEQQPRGFFQFGVLACEPHKEPWPVERDRLQTFCRSQDVDLFVYSYERDAPLYNCPGDLPPRLNRQVRARASMYAD